MQERLLLPADEQTQPSDDEIRTIAGALEKMALPPGGLQTGWGLVQSGNTDVAHIDTSPTVEPGENRTRSLHQSAHPGLSGLFVLSCVLNGGLFLWSNLSTGAEVWTTTCLTTECPTPTREKVFEFTLRTSVEAMWRAETYSVAILIVAGSAVWPYVKMIAMLAAWFWPVDECSQGEEWRGVVARILDLAGKFSLIDGFVMVLLSVGFGFTIGPILPPILMITVDVRSDHLRSVTNKVIEHSFSSICTGCISMSRSPCRMSSNALVGTTDDCAGGGDHGVCSFLWNAGFSMVGDAISFAASRALSGSQWWQ